MRPTSRKMPAKRLKTAGASIVPFGKHDGTAVQLVTLKLGAMVVKVSTYGATLTSIVVPNCRGAPVETVLGFGDLAAYEHCPFYLGCTVGRFANRIRGGTFPLEDGSGNEQIVKLAATNDRGNTLHGGTRGWDKHVWALVDASPTSCTLTHESSDGDEGFPGAVDARVQFSLEWGGRLVIRYHAEVRDKPTVISLTNHSYFNLTNGGSTDMLDHELCVFADHYLPTDANCLPTGEIKPVSGPMDLRSPTPIHRGIGKADGGGGYDHNYVVREDETDASGLRRAAWLRSPRTGIELDVFTSEPGNVCLHPVQGTASRSSCAPPCPPMRVCIGIQVCGANHLDGQHKGHGGRVYHSQAGICLETQKFPDAPNHPNDPAWPSAIVRPGVPFDSTTIYAFGASASSTLVH